MVDIKPESDINHARGFSFTEPRFIAPDDSAPKSDGTLKPALAGTEFGAQFASNTVQGPASIVELARALKNDPQLFYQFVHDNISWEPGWGVQKGPLGALIDGMGNAFDQSMLLVALLRQAGYTANYVQGAIQLLDTQYEAWWNVQDIWTAQSYCLNQYIPMIVPPTWNGTQYYMQISHVWVECVISGTTYVFDPSYKSYTRTSGIGSTALATAMGYNASTFLSDAESGATIDVSGNYVQNMNRTNIRADLKTLSTTLATYIKGNTIGTAPPGTATIDDLLGGQAIVPCLTDQTPLLQTSLPYAVSGYAYTQIWTGDVPASYKTQLTVQFPTWGQPFGNWDFTYTITSDQLAGTRLTLWYSTGLVPSLYLNGTVVATGVAQGSGTFTSLYLTVVHNAYIPVNTMTVQNYPTTYPGGGGGFQLNYQNTWNWWQSNIYAGSYYLIANAWGNLGRGQANYHQGQLAANKAAGGSSTSESVLGENLAVLWFTWAAQNSRVADLVNRIMICHTMYSHQVGIVSFDNAGDNALATDFGGVSGSSTYLPDDSSYAAKTTINDTVLAMHGVALEAAVTQQISGVGPGVSTTSVIDIANRTAIATISGAITVGDVLTITVHNSALSGGTKSDSYTVATGNTLSSIAAGLASAINGDSSLSAIGVTATSSGAAVSLSSTSANQTSYTSSTSVGATETITIAFQQIYKGTTSNWNPGSGFNLSTTLSANGYASGDLTNIYNFYISFGDYIVIPAQPSNTLASWSGWGYWAYPTAGAIGIINGILKGGSGQPGNPGQGPSNPNPGQNQDGQTGSLEPIGLFTGSYFYSRQDMTVGSQIFPYSLSFTRHYSSSNQYTNQTLGLGWSHNHAITAAAGSDGLLAMGSQYALQAVASIAELYVCTDIISDTTYPIAKLVTMSIADKWWVDQIVNNTVVVTVGSSSYVFGLLPNGSYAPPPNNASILTLAAGLYTLATPQGIKLNFNSSGQIATWVSPGGVTVTYSYSSGTLSTVSNGLGRTLTLHYTSGLLTSVTDGNGRTISYGYDGNNNLTTFTDAATAEFTYQYSPPGLMTQFFMPTNPTTAAMTNVYDSLNRVKTQSNALNQQWTYYLAGSRSEEDDPLSNSHIIYFNPFGSLVRDINPLGYEVDNAYDGLNRLTQSTFPETNAVQFTYDSNNNILTKTFVPKTGSGLSNVVNTMTYDPTWAKLKTFKDGNLNVYTYAYDASTGNLLSLTKPTVTAGTPEKQWTYNARGQVLLFTDETGIVTQYNYDTTTERLLSVVVDYNAVGHLNLTTQYGYDAVGNVNSITDPNNNQTSYTSDNERRLTQITSASPFSYITNRGYDGNSNLLTITRQTGNSASPWQTYTWTYSVTNQKKTLTDPAQRVTTWNYDGKDRLVNVIDAMSREYQYSYDAMNRLYQVTDPTNTICQTNLYTHNGRLASVEDANNHTTQYSYDGLDRLNKTTYADTTFEQNSSYDANSNVLTFVTRSANTITNTYDVLNRLGTKAPQSEAIVTYSYDLANRLLSTSKPTVSGDFSTGNFQMAYDTAGRFYQEEYPDSKLVTFVLDSNGNTTKITYPDGYFVNRDYDQLNRLIDIKLNGSATQAVTFAYDQLSRRTSMTFSNGASVSFGYASATVNDLSAIVQNFVGASVAFTYGYNNVQEITSLSASDPTYLLHPSAGGTATYGTASSVNEYPIVAGNSYSYNGNGCLTGDGTWTYVYDTENHLTSVSKTGTSVALTYDPSHRQAQKAVTTSGTTTTRYIYSGWRRIADYSEGGSEALLNRYVYGTGLDEPLIQITAAGTLTFYHANKQGSIVAITNSSGAVANKNLYGAFGETSLSGTTFGFTGQRFDSETGLYYYKRRYYSPTIGRFLQPDPIGYSGGLNLYGYVRNDPLGKRDPMGLIDLVKDPWGLISGGNGKGGSSNSGTEPSDGGFFGYYNPSDPNSNDTDPWDPNIPPPPPPDPFDLAPGVQIMNNPDGSVTYTYPNGSYVNVQPDGTYTVHYYDGLVVVVDGGEVIFHYTLPPSGPAIPPPSSGAPPPGSGSPPPGAPPPGPGPGQGSPPPGQGPSQGSPPPGGGELPPDDGGIVT